MGAAVGQANRPPSADEEELDPAGVDGDRMRPRRRRVVGHRRPVLRSGLEDVGVDPDPLGVAHVATEVAGGAQEHAFAATERARPAGSAAPCAEPATTPTWRPTTCSCRAACTSPTRRSAPTVSDQSDAPVSAVGRAVSTPRPTRRVGRRLPAPVAAGREVEDEGAQPRPDGDRPTPGARGGRAGRRSSASHNGPLGTALWIQACRGSATRSSASAVSSFSINWSTPMRLPSWPDPTWVDPAPLSRPPTAALRAAVGHGPRARALVPAAVRTAGQAPIFLAKGCEAPKPPR